MPPGLMSQLNGRIRRLCLTPAVAHFQQGAVIAERDITAKLFDGGEDVIEARPVFGNSGGAQAVFTEEFAGGVLGFGDAVGDHDDAVAG